LEITWRFFDDFCGTKLWALAFDDVFSFIAMGELYDVCKTLLYKYLQEELSSYFLFTLLISPLAT
jgi:hypothetical protein